MPWLLRASTLLPDLLTNLPGYLFAVYHLGGHVDGSNAGVEQAGNIPEGRCGQNPDRFGLLY